MNLFRRFLRPPNALILAYDHLDFDGGERLRTQVDEVRKFYEMSRLSDIVDSLAAGQPLGRAAVVFHASRKSLFVRALPFLRAEDIPVTIFVHGEWLGTNRLPPAEELRFYRR